MDRPVIALDLSRHVGWAVDSPGMPGLPIAGTWHLPGSQEDYGIAGDALDKHLIAHISKYKPGLIVYERPLDPRNLGDDKREAENPAEPPRKRFFAAFETIRLLIGLCMVVETVCHRSGVECAEVFVQSWRSHFTGTLKGGKEPTMARCRQLNWDFRSDNEADSMGIWAFVKAQKDPLWRPIAGKRRA